MAPQSVRSACDLGIDQMQPGLTSRLYSRSELIMSLKDPVALLLTTVTSYISTSRVVPETKQKNSISLFLLWMS
jgi:hypothetical protein